MNTRLSADEKKAIAMDRNRGPALSVLLPRALGAIRTCGLPYFNHDRTVFLQAERNGFRIWTRPARHYVYLHIGYHHIFSLFHVRLFSDGSGQYLDGRVSVIGWYRGENFRHWQAELFDVFLKDDDWLLSVPREIFEPNVVKSIHQRIVTFKSS